MDWVRTKSDEVAVDNGCTFSLPHADRVRSFFAKFLRHSKGQFAGKPFELLDWQWKDLIAPAFGWLRPDGSRRFRRVGCGVPKKNGKSTLLSGLALYALTGDREPGAEVYSAAADRDQASIIFNEAANMVEASPLEKLLDVRRSGKRIQFPAAKSVFRALSADVPTKEGLNIHFLLFDELHAQQNRELWNTLRYGTASRRQPMAWWISTAGYDRSSLAYEQWLKARGILDGSIIDTEFLACIYEAGESDDWTSERTWKAANPSFGLTLDSAAFDEDCKEAKASPVQENAFRRYRLNQWTQQQTRWIGMEKWNSCAEPFTLESLRGMRGTIGVDLASTSDLCAVVLAVRRPDGKLALWPEFFLPEMAVTRRAREGRTRVDEWAKAKRIRLTPGDVTDYGAVREYIHWLRGYVRIDEVACDPWNATQFSTDLQADNIPVVFVRQGFASLSPATKEFEKLVLGHALTHPAHPVMNFCVGNVATEQDAAGNIKPSKRRSLEKIDGVSAAVTALSAIIAKTRPKDSQYSKGGLQHV